MRKKRLIFLALLEVLLYCGSGLAQPAQRYFANPICEQADPWFIQYRGRYIACFSEANRGISVQMSDRLTAVGAKHIVWSVPGSGPASAEVWAPELHVLNGRWYVYFAASNGQNKNHRAWVLQSSGADPLGHYTLHGPLYTGDDPGFAAANRWAIDLTVFENGNQLYAIWSGWQDDQDVQYLYIAPMKDPLTMAGPRVRLCANNDYLWERVDESPSGRGLNEAPEVLQHDGRTFVTYSCSGSWQPSYKIGLLELKPGTDPLLPQNWIKYPKPAFASTERTYGVGHNSFVKSPDGTEDWLIYHAKLDRDNGWRRAVFAQRFDWSADGLPEFGQPVAAGQLLPVPSGESVHYVTGPRQFQFADASDMDNWSYFGHHQFIRMEEGKLVLGKLRGTPVNVFRSGEKVVFNGGWWTNFIMTARISMLEPHGEAGLLFRVNTPFVGFNGQRGYFAGIDYGRKIIKLGYTDGTTWHQFATAPLPRPFSRDCELKVVARQSSIEIDCDGRRLIQAREGTFTAGSIGLRVVDTGAAFSDVQIVPVIGKDSLAPSLAEGQPTPAE